MTVKYSSDKPSRCEFCYFWNSRKKRCIQECCYYILPEMKVTSMCNGCPYGRIYPCIGWCTQLILKS